MTSRRSYYYWSKPRREQQHGTRSRYRKGCRCAHCTEAERVYRADYRARQRRARLRLVG